MKRDFFFLIVLLIISLPLKAKSENLAQNPYTDMIEKISEQELSGLINKYPSDPTGNIQLTCLETNEQKLYIGLWHSLKINSPLKDAALVLEDFEKYPEVFEGIINSKVIKTTDSKKWLVEFENKSPVFFLPNIRYQMEYKMLSVKSGKLYKYHLSNLYPQSNITNSDGLIFLKEENGVTKFYELDFFNANWGIAGKLAGSNIWSDSINELAVSDLELKLRAENFKISSEEKKEKVRSFLKSISEGHLYEKCIKDKINSNSFINK
jgi:hypothetical protein